MTALWTSSEVARATGGRTDAGFEATGVSIDSRTLAPGELFVAIAGETFDGHDFVAAAFERGAAAALVARPLALDASLVHVPDTLKGLQDLGRFSRARSSAAVIAVTGSVGKTGTKEALRHCLSGQGATHASTGSFNNHWGVPLSLARMPRQTRFGIFELGMNHAGEIAALARQVRPDIAIITTIAPAHLGHFASIEAIADAKAEIFAGMDPSGTAILDRDNRFFDRLKAAAALRVIGAGTHEDAEARALTFTLTERTSRVEASILGEVVRYEISLPGRHWVANSLAVLAAVKLAGGNLREAAEALATLPPQPGRGSRHRIKAQSGSAELIDESYNASPASMQAAIAVLARAEPGPGGRRIAALGDMLELGLNTSRLHAELARPLIEGGIDLVFTAGPEMKALHEALPLARRGAHAENSAALAEILVQVLRPGDVVTVKGSHGSAMNLVVKRLTTPLEQS
ncbi:MAG TPA: UDP-N-acetylmuramoylalanyl-D-glutamyl-2,6-diaminopimelate--D-alanyl-D-alanine ligase [Stellaceae bacterium]|nr:UDP-N-acetylmuramoylalanyl-D-glutamyl-2,6-diaminopimelate--D-alanyl-D-alanine ligase [Stellaceae bacterium]